MNPISKSRKRSILLSTYACALIAVLAIFSFVSWHNLRGYRLAARYSAQEAFEETVAAVDSMSATLQKSLYATDGSMCARLCSQVYADARAAEAALSTLPFSTQELEQISSYLNQVGDYAYTLSAQAAGGGFDAEQAENLSRLSTVAASLSSSLRQLQSSFHSGAVEMDSRELRLRNVGTDLSAGKLSGELLRCESEFPRRASLSYDGKYGVQPEQDGGKELSDAEKLATAASFASVSPAEVKLAYDYEGAPGHKCYRAGNLLVLVGPQGVESMGQSRLISEKHVSPEKAQQIGYDFLQKHGYEDMVLLSAEESGGTAQLTFASTQDDALCLDNTLRLAVALDDGSIYAFNAQDYTPGVCDVRWELTEEQAQQKLPGQLTLTEISKVICRSAGKQDVACYELRCTDGQGQSVKIYVDARTGQQTDIVL